MKFNTLVKHFLNFFTFDRVAQFFIIYTSITLALSKGAIYGISLYLIITYGYYFFRNKMLNLKLQTIQYKFICDNNVKKYFVHKDLPALIEQIIQNLSKKHNYKMIPVEIFDCDEDGAFCSYYSNDTYQIELTTFALYNMGIVPNKNISNKSKKRLKATLAHEYAHFYNNDCFNTQFAELSKLYFALLLLLNLQFTYVFIPFILSSLYSKFVEYRADFFAWKSYPHELIVELKESKKEESNTLRLIDHFRFFFFGSHPRYSNRIKFINYMKAKV